MINRDPCSSSNTETRNPAVARECRLYRLRLKASKRERSFLLLTDALFSGIIVDLLRYTA